MKKVFSILAAVILLAGLMNVTALAHGGHGKGSGAARQSHYELCAVENCEAVGQHRHDGVWYCGPAGWQGNYEKCTVEGCTQLGLHEHSGEYYYCASYGTGHGCGGGWGASR